MIIQKIKQKMQSLRANGDLTWISLFPGWPGRDRNLIILCPFALISVRHLFAKTGGIKRKKAAKIGRTGNKKAL